MRRRITTTIQRRRLPLEDFFIIILVCNLVICYVSAFCSPFLYLYLYYYSGCLERDASTERRKRVSRVAHSSFMPIHPTAAALLVGTSRSRSLVGPNPYHSTLTTYVTLVVPFGSCIWRACAFVLFISLSSLSILK